MSPPTGGPRIPVSARSAAPIRPGPDRVGHAPPTGSRTAVATGLVVAATCLLGALYLRFGLAPAPGDETGAAPWLGVDQWAFAGPEWARLFVATAVAAGLAAAFRPDLVAVATRAVGGALDDRRVRLGAGAAAVLVCWTARTRQQNLDGSLLQQEFEAAAPRAFVTHDEMLELYLHSRLWAVLHATLGWDVALTYRVASCLAGGVATVIVLGLARRWPPGRRLLVVSGLLAGGWVLVFFGDVENYTWTDTIVLLYLAAALRFLDDRERRLWPVALVLAAGVVFHLEVLVLGPSLLVLAAVRVARGDRRDALAGVLLVPAVLGVALWWFDGHGLPIADLFTHSQISAQGGNWSQFLAPLDARYLATQLQLLLLLAPVVVLVPALLVDRGRRRTPHTAFLAVASAGGLLLVLLWRAQLGVTGDWDLYAVAAPPLGLLVSTWLADGSHPRSRTPWVAALLVLAATHTASWVAGNHAVLPG